MSAGSLFNHKLKHKSIKSYLCGFCAKQFVTAGQLKVHERIHTKEKIFNCKVRNIFFNINHTLFKLNT